MTGVLTRRGNSDTDIGRTRPSTSQGETTEETHPTNTLTSNSTFQNHKEIHFLLFKPFILWGFAIAVPVNQGLPGAAAPLFLRSVRTITVRIWGGDFFLFFFLTFCIVKDIAD